MMFIDYTSAFNTIILQKLIHKLVQLGLTILLCNWLLDCLTVSPQEVCVGSNTFSTVKLNTGATQRCLLSIFLLSLLSHNCIIYLAALSH